MALVAGLINNDENSILLKGIPNSRRVQKNTPFEAGHT